jgi:malate synthase
MKMIDKNGLKVSSTLLNFINNEVIPNTNINIDNFWSKFSNVVHELSPVNKALIEKRETLQKKIDDWHKSNKDKDFNKVNYIKFLKSVGYLIEEKDDFNIETTDVDNEISSIAGPQLVVPVDNARYALNAANARWGSLYNALYGTDVISGKIGKTWDKERAKKVINFVKDFLDERFPLQQSKWKDVSKIEVEAEKLILFCGSKRDFLKNNEQFIGYNGSKETLKSILIQNNNLHIDIIIDANTDVGKLDSASISDVIVESALSTIIDNEDSVAAVDAEDKVKCYRNWLGLMKGDLTSKFEKNGKKVVRKLNEDRNYISKNGKKINLHGRALLLNRNVGHLMTNPSIFLKDGSEIPEGIISI